MGVDAAVVVAAALVWAGGVMVLLWGRRRILARMDADEELRALRREGLRSSVDRPMLVWALVYAALGAFLTAIEIRRGVLVLYCAGLGLFAWGWTLQDSQRWWEQRPDRPRRSRPAGFGWALVALASLLGWYVASAFAGRLAVLALD